jgi:hypothetical protein
MSKEWDPPIPEPVGAGERPRTKLKSIKIPQDWEFVENALPEERQLAYKAPHCGPRSPRRRKAKGLGRTIWLML